MLKQSGIHGVTIPVSSKNVQFTVAAYLHHRLSKKFIENFTIFRGKVAFGTNLLYLIAWNSRTFLVTVLHFFHFLMDFLIRLNSQWGEVRTEKKEIDFCECHFAYFFIKVKVAKLGVRAFVFVMRNILIHFITIQAFEWIYEATCFVNDLLKLLDLKKTSKVIG